jgi:transcriptional regulator with XRE-family HTH domain
MGSISNYLRVWRKRWHLTQKELAFLLGYEDESMIGRFEREERPVTPSIANACFFIFGVEPNGLFPTLFDQMEADVTRRMRELSSRLSSGAPSKRKMAKLDRLIEALDRLSRDDDNNET